MQPEDREKLECCDQWATLLDAMRLHVETTEGEEVASSESAECATKRWCIIHVGRIETKCSSR